MKNDNNNNLTKLELLINNIREHLVSSVEASSFPSNTMIPFRTFSLRESLLHRISNLGSNAYDLFYKQNALSGIIIVRSILETVSILYLLTDKIEKAIESNELESFDKYLNRLILGSKNKSTDIKAINVLSGIDSWTKKEKGIRKMYNDLSEFAHPNWWGNLAAMGKVDKDKFRLVLGKENNKWVNLLEIGIISALVVLQSSEDIYNEMADILPQFVDLCKSKEM